MIKITERTEFFFLLHIYINFERMESTEGKIKPNKRGTIFYIKLFNYIQVYLLEGFFILKKNFKKN